MRAGTKQGSYIYNRKTMKILSHFISDPLRLIKIKAIFGQIWVYYLGWKRNYIILLKLFKEPMN